MGERKNKASIPAAAALIAVALGSNSAFGQSPVFAVIDIQPAESGIIISGKAFALSPIKVEAEMVIERKGKSGTVSTRQSRALDLQPGTTEDIARTGVNFGDGDTVAVTILLKHEGVIVAESTTTAGQ